MAAPRPVLTALAVAAIAALPLVPSSRGEDAASRGDAAYRALTAALDRAEFDTARELARVLAAETNGPLRSRKAAALGRLCEFLSAERGAPPPASGVVCEAGALRLSLAPDLAFAAATIGERGIVPLLFGHPDPFSSRFTLVIDGDPIVPGARSSLVAGRGVVEGRILERGIEVVVRLSGDAPPSWHPSASDARVRIEAIATNRSDRPRSIGARLLLDLAVGFDDAPGPRVGPGETIALACDWTGDQVPRRLTIGSRSVVLRGLLASAPDRAVLSPAAPAEASAFDFALDGATPLGADSALALYAEPRLLAPGESLTITAQLAPDEEDVDGAPPVGIALFSEPVAAIPDATRLLLLLRGGARGTAGDVSAVAIEPRLDPGLELLSAPSDLGALGTLPPGVTIQRSIVVRPDLTAGGAPNVAFEVSGRFSRAPGERVSRRATAPVSVPERVALSGRVVDPTGRSVPDCEVVVRQRGRDVAIVRSDGAGAYRAEGLLPEPCEVRASRVVYAEPAAKGARAALDELLLDVVLTSETIDDAGNHRLPVFAPGAGRDVVLARSLTRYSMLVVVEWDATREYLEGLARGMRKAAEFLYAASDGHFTFGRIAIRDCGVDWNHADFWDWANNSVHPNASVGGIRHRYHPLHAPWNTAINFGRQWDSSWEGGGLFTTVVHEFGHYGFALYDEYLGAPQGVHRGLSYPEMCRCIMGYQYSDHKICFAANHRHYTNQGMWNGRSCWEQLEAMHEGSRGGFFAAVLTPAERGGVTPPPVGNAAGAALSIVIDDHSTGGRDVPLEVVGAFGRAPAGVPVYTESAIEGRSVYHGVTDGAGRLTLMGVHPGDRVTATYSGARAATTLSDFAPARLEFGIEPRADSQAPFVLVTPELVAGANEPESAGITIEIHPGAAGAGAARVEALRPRRSELPVSRTDDGRIVTLARTAELPLGRGAFAIELEDPRDGASNVLTEVVIGEGTVFSFDGSVEVAANPPRRIAIASTSGPERVGDSGVVRGRVTSIVAVRGETVAVDAVFVVPDADDRCELRIIDPLTRATRPVPVEPLAPDRSRARLETPALVAWFERE